MREDQLYEQIAHYMRLQHPDVLFHFDLSGMWTSSHKARNLYGRLNKRAFPDLFIAKPREFGVRVEGNPTVYPRTAFSGLFLELKREGTRLKTRDGRWASQHIDEQAAVLDELQDRGYIAQFAVGFDEAVQLIDSYLKGGTHDTPPF